MTRYSGRLRGDGVRIAVVTSRFNDLVTERLLAGCLDGLDRLGVDPFEHTVEELTTLVRGHAGPPPGERRTARAAVPAAGQLLRVVIGGLRSVRQRLGRIAIHHHLAADEIHAEVQALGEQQGDRRGDQQAGNGEGHAPPAQLPERLESAPINSGGDGGGVRDRGDPATRVRLRPPRGRRRSRRTLSGRPHICTTSTRPELFFEMRLPEGTATKQSRFRARFEPASQ